MQGATHRAGGVTAALTGYMTLKHGASPVDLGIDPLASLAIIYPFALWGSVASDLDHSPGSLWDEVKLAGKRSGHTIPSKDPVSRLISHVLHLTKAPRKHFKRRTTAHNLLGILDCKHRSWQTHSEIPILFCLFMIFWVRGSGNTLSSFIYEMVFIGILFGFIAHLILDLLTPEGLPFATGMFINRLILHKKVLPERIKIVPHVPPKEQGKPGFFSTGGTWEKAIIFNILHAINLVLVAVVTYDQFFPGMIDLTIR